jgi:outer membrane protein TolC
VANKQAARGTDLPVQRFQAEVNKNQSEKLIVKQEIIEAENRINLLAGRFPQAVDRAKVDFINLNLRTLQVGVPAQLLANRRDIQQAEHEVAAAGLDVLVARAHFFPSLDIRGTVGYEAFNPRFLFNPDALVADVAAGITAPLLNRQAIKAEYIGANAKQLQAIYNYQQVVLTAFTEVVNSFSKVDKYRASVALRQDQLNALEASVDVASRLFQTARAEYVEVLLAQRDLLDAKTGLIDTKKEQLSAVVRAYQALGGGTVTWNSPRDGGVVIEAPPEPEPAGPRLTPPPAPEAEEAAPIPPRAPEREGASRLPLELPIRKQAKRSPPEAPIADFDASEPPLPGAGSSE